MNKRKIRVQTELLEQRYCLSTITFVEERISEADFATFSSFLEDFDGDGDIDVLTSTGKGNSVWFANNGDGVFEGPRHLANIGGLRAVADVDGDSDYDLIGSRQGTTLWYENTDGRGSFSEANVISTNFLNDFHVGDVDGDGDLDAFGGYFGISEWYENVDGKGVFSDPIPFPASGSVADIDSDGDLDLINSGGILGPAALTWYQNSGNGRDFVQKTVNANNEGSILGTADLDGDGDEDLLVSHFRERIVWYENLDSNGTFANPQTVLELPDSGDVRLLKSPNQTPKLLLTQSIGRNGGTNETELIVYRFMPNERMFDTGQTVASELGDIVNVREADLDRDGDGDLLFPSAGALAWHENLGRQLGFDKQAITQPSLRDPLPTSVADLDGDGDKDVLTASGFDGRVVWYEDGLSTKEHIVSEVVRVNSVEAADMDGDGDNDVLASIRSTIVWYENEPPGQFTERTVVPSDGFGNPAYAVDLDSDGDLDVMTIAFRSIRWYRNLDGQGNFGEARVLADAEGASIRSLVPVVNGDSISILASTVGSGILWFEKSFDVQGLPFAVSTRIRTPHLRSGAVAVVVDIDGDGNRDIVAASPYDSMISWFKNEGPADFSEPNLVQAADSGILALTSNDLDGDGDSDIVAATISGQVRWYENLDNTDDFRDGDLVSLRDREAVSVVVSDMDNDGDNDIVTASSGFDRIAWFESRTIGDSNDDGVFNSSDLVKVFQAGQYEDNLKGNSTFDDGDWNGDGDFDSSDLVFAFRAGTFVANAIGLHPEVIDLVFDLEDQFQKLRNHPPLSAIL